MSDLVYKSNIIYKSDFAVVCNATGKGALQRGLEIYLLKKDIIGNNYMEWAGLIEESSPYYKFIMLMIDNCRRQEVMIADKDGVIKELREQLGNKS